MVGQGVLRECLLDANVEGVLAIVRNSSLPKHEKLHEIVHKDLSHLSTIEGTLSGYDACFFCLGVSSVGMTEADYYRQTFDLTLAAARALAAARPGATFCYVSGEGTDSSERGRSMWARVKGKTENALLELPLKAYMFRPGFIRPRRGTRSKTRWYRVMYAVLDPIYPLLRRIVPSHVTTAENVGRAMIAVAATGYQKRVLENVDINAIGAAS